MVSLFVYGRLTPLLLGFLCLLAHFVLLLTPFLQPVLIQLQETPAPPDQLYFGLCLGFHLVPAVFIEVLLRYLGVGLLGLHLVTGFLWLLCIDSHRLLVHLMVSVLLLLSPLSLLLLPLSLLLFLRPQVDV